MEKGYNNPEDMTEERAEAIEAKMDEVLTAYSEGELTDDDVASYVEDNATEAEIDLLGDEYDDEDSDTEDYDDSSESDGFDSEKLDEDEEQTSEGTNCAM